MARIAITGNIAAGKSVVENILKERGYNVYDTDKMTHELLNSSEEVKTAFKSYDILEGKDISRKKLGKLVFENEELRKVLESIIHPAIREKISSIQDEGLVFIAVPLLFEANMESLFDKIIFVSADEEIRLKRLIARNSLTKQEALQRIRSQALEKNKISKADYVIINNDTIEKVIEQTDFVLKDLLKAVENF